MLDDMGWSTLLWGRVGLGCIGGVWCEGGEVGYRELRFKMMIRYDCYACYDIREKGIGRGIGRGEGEEGREKRALLC